MTPGSLPEVHLLGARLHALTESECVSLVLGELDAGKGGWIITMNLDHLRQFVHDPQYLSYYARATLVIADGMPLIWASRIQSTPLPERVTGSTLIWSLSAAAAERGRSIFLLGGTPFALKQTAQVLMANYPRLRIVGSCSPYRGFDKDEAEMERMTQSLTAAQPDIIYVALGAPKQEKLIERVQSYLPAAWWLGVGISFSFVAAEIPRAPLWMQRVGLEWLYRLACEPGRLARRYLLNDLPFAATLFYAALRTRWRRSN